MGCHFFFFKDLLFIYLFLLSNLVPRGKKRRGEGKRIIKVVGSYESKLAIGTPVSLR